MSSDQPTKKVVKRVVKKAAAPQPTIRYGRPVEPKPAVTQAAPAAKASPARAPAKAPATQQSPTVVPTRTRPSLPRPQLPSVRPAFDAARDRVASLATATGRRSMAAGHAVGDVLAVRYQAARAWRIPHVEPVRATLLTGLLVGLVSVALAVASLAMFSQLRGVAGGGGRWGSLVFLAVVLIALFLGERLLTAFGTPAARLISFMGVLLTLIAMLAVFLPLSDSVVGLVLVPVLSALAFAASHRLLMLAETDATR